MFGLPWIMFRYLALGIVGNLCVIAASSQALACSLAQRQPEVRPFYPYLVRNSSFIDLARVLSVEVGQPDGTDDFQRNSRSIVVRFEVVEALKGDASGEFEVQLRGALETRSQGAGEIDVSQDPELPYFWTSFNIYDTPMQSDCTLVFPRFTPGEQYAVFRAEDGTAVPMLDAYGRNFHRVSNPSTSPWLSALRVLVADPERQHGHQMNAREFVSLHGVAALVAESQCGDWRVSEFASLGGQFELADWDSMDGPGRFWMLSVFSNEEQSFCETEDSRGHMALARCPANLPTECEVDQRLLLLPAKRFDTPDIGRIDYMRAIGYPVDDTGTVDFGVRPIDLSLQSAENVTLDDVRTWLSDD